ncbi:MAG: methyl-accepting chemotaxis protein [Cyanobacteria bacterium J06614_10]
MSQSDKVSTDISLATAQATSHPTNGPSSSPSVTQPREGPTGHLSWWTLKNKATLIAVALGTLPVLVVGGISTAIAGKQLSRDAIEQQQQFTNAVTLTVQETDARLSASEVNRRIATLRQGIDSAENTLQFSVVDNRRNQILLSNNPADTNTTIEALFPEYANLGDRTTAATFKSRSTQDNRIYLLTYAPIDSTGSATSGLGVLVSQPMSEVFAAQQSLVLALLSGTVITALVVSTLAAYLANRATRPIIAASRAVAKLGKGKFDTRLKVESNDELAVLNSNINVMAEQLEYQLEFIEETAKRQGLFQAQADIAQQQRQARASLQQALSSLLQSVAPVGEGDLTVQAQPSSGEIGQLGELFNAVISQLREIVVTIRQTNWQVTNVVESNQVHRQQQTQVASSQAENLSGAIASADTLSTSVASVMNSTEQAQYIAHQTVNSAQQTEQLLATATENATERQATLSETTDRIKLLGRSSQQLSQVVSLINEMALKINLLAINANIETKQANETGEGFSVAAGEISQLTDQTTRATREIERLAKGIQDEAKETSRALELGIAGAIADSTHLTEARNSASQAAKASTEVDSLLRSMAETARTQQTTTQSITALIQQITLSSQHISETTTQTEATLRSTAEATRELADAVSGFTLDD